MSLACPISSHVLINAKRSEESLGCSAPQVHVDYIDNLKPLQDNVTSNDDLDVTLRRASMAMNLSVSLCKMVHCSQAIARFSSILSLQVTVWEYSHQNCQTFCVVVVASVAGKPARQSLKQSGQSRGINTTQAVQLSDPDGSVRELGGDASST